MKTLKHKRKVEKGKIFDSYFDNEHNLVTITKGVPFTGERYEKEVDTFVCNGKEYAVVGYDHFNGHLSGFTDRSAIYGIYIAEVINS